VVLLKDFGVEIGHAATVLTADYDDLAALGAVELVLLLALALGGTAVPVFALG